MSMLIDLMPDRCRESLGRRRRVRRWITAFLCASAIFGAVHWTQHARSASLEREHRRLADSVKEAWDRNQEVQRLLVEIQHAEDSITRYNRLAWPVRVGDVVAAIGATIPPSVSLTSLAITPREERRAAAPRKPGDAQAAAPAEGPKTFMVIEAEGVTPDDAGLASLVSGLEASPLFSKVSLDYARSGVVDGIEARLFRLTTEIDLSVRYSLSQTGSAAAAPTEEAP